MKNPMFTGLSAFPITPASEDGAVDANAVARLTERLIVPGISSIGLLGSTGTYAFLSRDQRRRAIEAAVASVAGRLPLIVGIGALRTDAVVAHAEDAEAAGADGFLLAPVSYTPLNSEEVFEHFRTVSAASSLPICIYNNPGTTHFTFDVELLARLAELPNVQAVKMPLPSGGPIADDLATLRAALPDDFSIGYSGDWGCADGMLAGADAWYSVIAGTLPEVIAELATAASGKNAERTKELNDRLGPLWKLFQEVGSLRVVYAMSNLMQLTDCQPPRPVLPVPQDQMRRVREILDTI